MTSVRYCIAHIDHSNRGFILALDDNRRSTTSCAYYPLLKADKSAQWSILGSRGMLKFSEILKYAHLHAVVEVFSPPTYPAGAVVHSSLYELCQPAVLQALPNLCHQRARLVLEKASRSAIGYIVRTESFSDELEVLSYLVADPVSTAYVSVPAGTLHNGRHGDPVQLSFKEVGKGAVLFTTKGGKNKLVLPARFPLKGGKRLTEFNVHCEVTRVERWNGCHLDFQQLLDSIDGRGRQIRSPAPLPRSASSTPVSSYEPLASQTLPPTEQIASPMPVNSSTSQSEERTSSRLSSVSEDIDDVIIIETKTEIKQELVGSSTISQNTDDPPLSRQTLQKRRQSTELSEAPREKRRFDQKPIKEEKPDPTAMIQSELLGFLPRLQKIHAQGRYKDAIQSIVSVLIDLDNS